MLPFLIFSLSLIFYLATLAPTVLWGDDAFFQRAAYESLSMPYVIDHWLWLKIAQWFVRLPWGDPAYRVNLLSAVAAALTVTLLYASGRAIRLSPLAAVVAAASLAVAHTFWMHAVRAEVYTVFTALMLLQLWLWFSWRPERSWPLYVAALLSGLTLLGHQMALLLLPGAAVLLWQQRHWLRGRQWLWLLLSLFVGMVSFVAVVWGQNGGDSLTAALYDHFTRNGQFRNVLLDFSLASLPRDFALWLGFLGLQFVGPAGLLGLWGIYCVLRIAYSEDANTQYAIGNTLLVLYLTTVLFAFSYHVNDQYVFYLPSFVIFALFVGLGWDNLGRIPYSVFRIQRSPNTQYAIRNTSLLLALIVIPITTYAILPRLLTAAELNPMGIRQLPGREPNSFFLWPGKGGYTGAADYGRAALEQLPENAVLIADHTPVETLVYLQSVAGLRPDVRLVKIEPGDDLRPVLARPDLAGAAIFLADNGPDYYNLSSLPDVRLEPSGVVYRLLTTR